MAVGCCGAEKEKDFRVFLSKDSSAHSFKQWWIKPTIYDFVVVSRAHNRRTSYVGLFSRKRGKRSCTSPTITIVVDVVVVMHYRKPVFWSDSGLLHRLRLIFIECSISLCIFYNLFLHIETHLLYVCICVVMSLFLRFRGGTRQEKKTMKTFQKKSVYIGNTKDT